MILISYPSGGFGNFLYHVLTEFASNTYKPHTQNFSFDSAGRSHSTRKYTPVYFRNPIDYKLILPDTDLECLILCDNGITDDSYTQINRVFPGATIVRSIISYNVRPIVYKTCTTKAMNSSTLDETIDHVDKNWDNRDNYSIRENFTLLYHNWPFAWGPDANCINVDIEDLIIKPVETLSTLITKLQGNVIDAERLTITCNDWITANTQYFKIYHDWIKIEQALDCQKHVDISNIVDLHDQGYINYRLEKKFNYTIPVYDYRNWFKNTQEIPTTL